MIRAVLFDFDGTLATFRGRFPDLLDSLRAELMLTQCDLKTFAGVLSEEIRHDGAVTLHSALLRTLERLELRAGDDVAAVAAQAVRDYGRQVELLPGALELLDGLRGRVRLALVSNGPEDMQRAALEAVGIAGYFDAILVSGAADVAVRKPGRRVFELACRRLGVAPAEALMVGDNLAADIEGAQGCGLDVVHIGEAAGPAASPAAGQAVRKVRDLFELRALLREILA